MRAPRPNAVATASAITIAVALAVVLTRPYDGALFRKAGSGGAWSPYLEYIRVVDLFSNPYLDLRLRLFASDGPYPPLLHFVMAPIGSIFGHGDLAITRLMVLWVLLLAGGVGVVAGRLAGDSRVGWVAAAGTATVPAVTSLGLVYFHDLPMAAILWWVPASILLLRRRSPELAGLVAGLVCFAAGFAKWTALPLIPTVVAGALLTHMPGERWSRREVVRRLRLLVVAAAVTVLLLQGWFDISTTSWRSMSATTMRDAQAFGGESGAVSWDALVGIWHRIQWHGAPTWTTGLLVSTVTHVISPLLALLLLLAGGRWLVKDRRGGALVTCIFLGQLAFFVTLVPVADSRMLVPAVPALVIAATLGLAGATRGIKLAAASAWVAIALTVLVDVHHLPDGSAFSRDWYWGDSRATAPFAGRRLSIASGDPTTAWQRLDEQQGSIWYLEREELWRSLVRCSAVKLVIDDGVTGDPSDVTWFTWRNMVAEARGEDSYDKVSGMQGDETLGDEAEVVISRDQLHPDLLLFERFGELGIWVQSRAWCSD